MANTRRKTLLQASSTQDHSDSDDDIIYSRREQRVPTVPQPKPPTRPTWQDRYRRYIEDRSEPLDRPIADASETILRSLDEAQKAQIEPIRILEKLEKIAHESWVKKISAVFKDDANATVRESEAEGSDGDEYAPDILECFRRITLLEAKVHKTPNTDPEDEPVPVAGHQRRRQKEKQGNVLSQYRNDMAR